MALYVTGDWHGGFPVTRRRLSAGNWPEGQSLGISDYLVILGDFGLFYDNSSDDADGLLFLDSRRWSTLFIDGNHENHPALRRLPVEMWNGGETSLVPGTQIRWLRRGQVFEICGVRVFTMGGARSIDAEWREAGDGWWPQELPSSAEMKAAEENLDRVGWKVDHVLTHDCPRRYLPQVTAHSPFGNLERTDRLEKWLDKVDDELAFDHWWFGHHHIDMDLDERHSCVMNRVIRIA